MSDRQAIFVVKSNSLGTEINYEFVSISSLAMNPEYGRLFFVLNSDNVKLFTFRPFALYSTKYSYSSIDYDSGL